MEDSKLKDFIGSGKLTVVEAMRKINTNNNGILFLTDCAGMIAGCLTDGDIRRFLLAGGSLDDNALEASNKNPRIAKDIFEAKSLYHKKNYVVIPIVDSKGLIVDVFTGDGEEKRINPALDIPVVINAGGRGTRLEPYTKVLPKPLIPVGDYPIIEQIMNEYESFGCNDFHIIVNYKKDLIKAYFADSDKNYSIHWYDEQKPLGTGGGLTLLRGRLSSTFFFTNCDNLLRANYDSMLKFHRENNNAITMICAYMTFSIPYGVVDMGVNGTIKSMREKPQLSYLTNTGIYIVEPSVIDDMADGEAIGFPDVVDMERKKGRNVAVFPVSENEWMDMGQISELEKMRIKICGE